MDGTTQLIIDSEWVSRVEVLLNNLVTNQQFDIGKRVDPSRQSHFIELCKLRMQGDKQREYVFSEDYLIFKRIK